jgi:hypothetical protein
MATTYTFQTNEVLTSISQNLIQSASLDDPIFKIFPIRPRNASRLRWTVKDNFKGLMKLRGLGGEPTPIQRVGVNVYEDIPGVYGEFATVDEIEMTNRAQGFPANLNVPISVDDLVNESQEQLTLRQVQRMKQICWALAISGTFSVALPTGGIGHTGSYTPQTVTVSPLWSVPATATPLKNFRDLQPAFGKGTSTLFNGMAQAWTNSVTANYALANTNAADLGGKRNSGGGTIDGIAGVNRVLLDQNVPQLNIWDDGYIDDAGTFQLYVPDGKVLVVGKRPNGETPGEFQMTRNLVSQASTPYSHIDDRANPGPRQAIPPRMDIHQGFNGGPVIERGTQLVVMTVA